MVRKKQLEMKHIKYPDTGQFRTVVKTVTNKARFVGLDDNGDAIFDGSIDLPVIKAKGTVKLHGTNAGVSYNDTDGVYAQSRNNAFALDLVSAHMGFNFFVNSKKDLFLNVFNYIKNKHNIDTSVFTISIYGEWAGKGIQKTVSISELDKSFYLFGCKISNPNDKEFSSYWVDVSEITFPESENMWNINEFETFEEEIDFNSPGEANNRFIELVDYVEKECPVAKHFGVSGIGEGIVWEFNFKGDRYIFKTKGEKHAGKSKTKTLKPVDNAEIARLQNIAEDLTPTWRLNQMFNEITDQGKNIERRLIGQYIKAVLADIVKEEMDILNDNKLEPKDIGKYVSQIAKNYFFQQEIL